MGPDINIVFFLFVGLVRSRGRDAVDVEKR
jgi:hypothetical protein